VRPRYGRLTALGASLAVTGVAVLGSMGALPQSGGGAAAEERTSSPEATRAAADLGSVVVPGTEQTEESGIASGIAAGIAELEAVDEVDDTALPADSGSGKRVVFSQSRQRVWLVPRGSKVARTYLVSGSVYDNLQPGTYHVYSRSENAWGIDDSGTMKWFVRFTQGENAAIGFHDIPVDDGKPVQTKAQLGTPQSHGCIRQKESDARALWDFAPIGTTVVVTA
jgi:lipoprotein-anchoring transpeptidase ErfK/SrfK